MPQQRASDPAGSEVELVAVHDFRASMLAEYEGLIVGSPCWAGSSLGIWKGPSVKPEDESRFKSYGAEFAA